MVKKMSLLSAFALARASSSSICQWTRVSAWARINGFVLSPARFRSGGPEDSCVVLDSAGPEVA